MTAQLSNRRKGLRWYSPFVMGADFMMRPLCPARPHILIPCMVKSGSTFLAHALAAHNGLRRVRLTPAWGAREQELCELRLSRYNHYAYVSQHHIKNSDWTQELIRRYQMTPVVLVRNLFDIVISLRDHIRRESHVMSMAFFTEEHARLPDRDLEDVIVDLAMPWFIHFYVSWRQSRDTIMMDYAEVVKSPDAAMARILDLAGIPCSQTTIDHALSQIEGKNNRLNKGVSDRGRSLDIKNRQKIVQMLSYYPEILNDPYVRSMTDMV